MTPHRKTFRFSILAGLGAWRWRTLDSGGVVLASGLAPSRKLAAASVIWALTAWKAAKSDAVAANHMPSADQAAIGAAA